MLIALLYYLAFFVISVTSTFECAVGNVTIQSGEETVLQEHFVAKCVATEENGWKLDIVACLINDTIRVPVNGSLVVNGHKYSCANTTSGIKFIEDGASSCCADHAEGDTWIEEEVFEYKCKSGKKSIQNCIANDGSKIPINSTKDIDGTVLICKVNENGYVTFSTNTSRADCKDSEGSRHAFGTFWMEGNHFNKTCEAHGAQKIVSCIAKDGFTVEFPSSVIHEGRNYTCKAGENGGVIFSVKEHVVN